MDKFKKIIDITFGELIMIVENELMKVCKDGITVLNISIPSEFEWENGEIDDEIYVEFTLDSDKDNNLHKYSMIWSRKGSYFSTLKNENQ